MNNDNKDKLDIEPIQIDKNVEIVDSVHLQNNSSLINDGVGHFLSLGATRSGKSYAILTVLKMIHEPFTVILFCRMPSHVIYTTIKNYCDSKEIKYINLNYDDTEKFKEVKDIVKNNKLPLLLIADDITTDISKEHEQFFNMSFSRGRHKLIYCLFITQQFSSLPKMSRLNFSYILVFNSPNKYYNQSLMLALSNTIPYDTLKSAFHEMSINQYSYLFVNILSPEKSCIIFKDKTIKKIII